MKLKKELLDKPWVAYTFALCSAVIVYLVISHIYIVFRALKGLANIFWPITLGFIVAYVLNPVVTYLERNLFVKTKSRSMARNMSTLITYLIVIICVGLLMFSLLPQVANSIIGIFNNVEVYAQIVQGYISDLGNSPVGHFIDMNSLNNFTENIYNYVISNIPKGTTGIINTASNIGVSLFNIVIAFFISVYLLVDKKRLASGLERGYKAVVPKRYHKSSLAFIKRCHRILIRFIGCDILDGLIIGIANFIFMIIMNLPYPTLLSIVVGVTNLAPTFGPIVGGIIGAALLLLVDPWYALWFILFTIVLQTIDGYILKPKLFGETFGVPSVVILIFIIIGGRLVGIWGILLSIPFAAICDFIYKDYLLPYLEKRNQ